MLGFLRRHQRKFFIFITVIIVISFSFFGTYNTLSNINTQTDEYVFTAADGSNVTNREVELLAQFLRTDRKDKVNYGGIWGPNFLNDGVIEKDFLETGLAKMLILRNTDLLQSDFQSRHRKEQRYQPYQHPSADFISVKNAWNAMLPEMTRHFRVMQEVENPLSNEGVDARISLYVLERQFPPHTMKQLLAYQERQYGWVQQDPDLRQADLFLFGYHQGEDWFGPAFYRMTARFIIHSARYAEMLGYSVSDKEALASLLQNVNASYEENRKSPYLLVGSPQAYFREQLRRMRLDQKKAVKIWKNVLLMRRLFQEAGDSVYIDPFTSKDFAEFAHASITGELFQYPEPFRISDFRTLTLLEFYLDALFENKEGSIHMPERIRSAESVRKTAPELVQKKYRINMKHLDLNKLEANIGIKELWNWQTEQENWDLLQENFPTLGIVEAETEDERFKAIEKLDPVVRSKVNGFSRKKMIGQKPEKIEEALAQKDFETVEIRIGRLGTDPSLQGIEEGEKLIRTLDRTKPEEEVEFLAEEGNIYRFVVLEKYEDPEILTYADAVNRGVMKKIADRKLQSHYERIREDNSEPFRKKEGGWKPLSEVRESVASDYFALLLKNLKEDFLLHHQNDEQALTNDRLASYRLVPFAREGMAAVKSGGDGQRWIAGDDDGQGLADQWKLRKKIRSFQRRDQNKIVSLFENPDKVWVDLATPPNGDITFFHVIERGSEGIAAAQNQFVAKIKNRMGPEVVKNLAQELLENYPLDFGGKDAG